MEKGAKSLEKGEFLEWLMKPRAGYPFVTYRGGAMRAVANFEIPLDEISEFLDAQELNIGGQIYMKKGA
jgi:hypothetical protein